MCSAPSNRLIRLGFMSNGVNNDNTENKTISINELQRKLSSSESTIYTEQGMKSIFDAYNTKKTSDKESVEVLDSDELQSLIDDIKSYDGKIDNNKKDGYIDADEADLFIRDFNEKHKDSPIKSEDLFGFIANFLKRQNVNDKKSESVQRDVETVGKPLSKKSVSMVAYVDGEPKDVEINIELYATKDEKYVLMYKYGATTGSEYQQSIAKEYGYVGDKAWSEFMTNSLHFDSNTYEISFKPTSADNKNKKVSTSNVTGGSPTSLSRIGTRVNKPLTDKEISEIDDRYASPDVVNTIAAFCDFLKTSIAQAEQDLNNYAKTYGWAEHVADLIGEIRDVNTMSNMRQMIADAKQYLYMMLNADNSPEGIKAGKDFFEVFRNFTGKENFDEKEVQKFLQTKLKYESKEPVIKTYKYIKSNLNDSVKEYAKYYYGNHYHNNINNNEYNQKKMTEAYDNMFNMFSSLTGISKENFNNMLNGIVQRGDDPIEFLKNFSKNIIKISEQNVKETLGIDDLKDLDDYEDNLKDEYNESRKRALGDDGDLVNRISKYNDSQIMVGSVVSGVAQMGLYAACMALCPEFAFVKGLESIASISKTSAKILSLLSKEGLRSGSSYALSSIVIDSSNRLTDEIDEDNIEATKSVMKTATIEFLAGYLFDGYLKAKIFKKGESKVIKKEDAIREAYDEIGKKFLDSPGIRFRAEYVGKIAATRATAGVIGGTKDSVKETFKESCSGQYSLSSIGLAFIAGAISNATMIKFKNSSFTKEEHKILGKFIEKAPKKGTKNDINAYLNSIDKDDQVYVKDYLKKVKIEILQYMNTHSTEDGAQEVLHFIKTTPEALDEMIISYAIIEDSINNVK